MGFLEWEREYLICSFKYEGNFSSQEKKWRTYPVSQSNLVEEMKVSIQFSVSSPVIIFTAQVPLRRAIDSLYVEFQKVVFMETE